MTNQTIEQQVRELDNESVSVAQSAREISKAIGVGKKTAEQYLYVKRKEFASNHQYLESLARKKGFKGVIDRSENLASKNGEKNRLERYAKNQGYNTHNDYLDALALKRGFIDNNEYQRFLKRNNDYEEPEEFIQRKFDEIFNQSKIKLLPNRVLDSLPHIQINRLEQRKEAQEVISKALEILDGEERQIIEKRYFGKRQKSQREISDETGYPQTTVFHIQKRAFEKMRAYIRYLWST